jgi:hypothetical protein
VYLREEVDTYAEKWFAFLTDQEPPKTVFEVGKPEDMDGVYDLSKRAIGQTMDADTRRGWLAKNPQCCYIVKHKEKVVAFIHILPLKHDTLIDFMAGKIRGWDLKGEDVEAFEPGKALECWLAIASEPDVAEITRMHYVRVLLRGIRRELGELGRRGVILSKFYATSATPTGIAMAFHAGMEEDGTRLGKRLAFTLETKKSKSFLLDSYKEGFAEWEKSQKTQPQKNRKNHVSSGQ